MKKEWTVFLYVTIKVTYMNRTVIYIYYDHPLSTATATATATTNHIIP